MSGPPPTTPSSTTIAWFHCFAGIAGDMALGSLIDAGADVDEIRLLLQRLSLPGWELAVEQSPVSYTHLRLRGARGRRPPR